MNTSSEEISFTIKQGPFDRRPRQLIINKDFISFEDGKSLSEPPTRFEKQNINGIRYGIKWIRGFEFTVGRAYQIFIRNDEDKILKISFKSYYGKNKQSNYNQYAEIIEALWNFHIKDMAVNLLNTYEQTGRLTLAHINFSEEYLEIKVAGLIKEEEKRIEWQDVGIRNYQTYFAIFSLTDTAKTNRTYSYLEDWNTLLLNRVINAILPVKNSNHVENI